MVKHNAPISLHNDLFDLPFGIIMINRYKTIVTCNKYAAGLLNSSSETLINKQYDKVLGIIPSIETYSTNEEFAIDSKRIEVEGSQLIFSTLFIDYRTNSIAGILLRPSQGQEKSSFSLNNSSFQQVLDSSLDEIFITDGNGTILFINSAAEFLYGEKPKDLVGRSVIELEEKGYFSPSLFPIVQERKEKVSMMQRTKTGKTHHVIAYPSFNENKELINVVFNARDITEIKYLREKIERSETLIETYKSELKELQNFHDKNKNHITLAPKMLKIEKMIDKVAGFDTTILVTGESGVGKGVLVREIHEKSNRKDKPFVHVNCGAIPESLIESELFGYEGGAFTGAKQEGQKGLIEQANGGTFFLDEIGEMPLHLQVKLLKVLQDKQLQRIGGSASIKVDIRIIAATNQVLAELVDKKLFRRDLYYRLNVIPVHIPPLRKRPEDVSYMIDFFLNSFNEKYDLSKYLSLSAENMLTRYSWPGNVRELENLMERLVVTSDTDEIDVGDLPDDIIFLEEQEQALSVHNITTLKQAQEEMEKQLIRKAYEIDTSSYKIASMLGINQSTAHRKINQYIKKNES